MIQRVFLPACAALAVVAFPAVADTDHAADTDYEIFNSERFSAGVGLGILSGQAKELVYDPDEGGRKLSQLDWKYSNAPIIKGSFEWNALSRLSVGASGWMTIASHNGQMDDYDWLDESQRKWTEHSSHGNTHLEYANEFDLNVKGWILNEPTYRFGVMAGYQESRFSFTAKGGSYRYDNGAYVGNFSAGLTGISYKQRFKVPYIGLVGDYRYKKFEFGGAFKYSGWVHASDDDEHHYRQTTFTGKIRNQSYYSLAGNVAYYLTDNAKIYVEGVWSHATNKKGSTSIHGFDDDGAFSETVPNSAGIESRSFMTAIGLRYAF